MPRPDNALALVVATLSVAFIGFSFWLAIGPVASSGLGGSAALARIAGFCFAAGSTLALWIAAVTVAEHRSLIVTTSHTA